MTVETEPMNLPAGSPDIDLEGYKINEPEDQATPPKESFGARARSRKTAAPKTTKTKERVPASRPGEFVEPLTQMYTMIGMGTVAFDVRAGHEDHNCGPVIVENAEKIAKSWDDLAQQNDQVRKALRTMLQGSAWAGVIGAHLPIAMAIFSNHAPGSLPKMIKTEDDQDQPATDDLQTPTPRKRTVPGRARQYQRPPVNGAAHGA